MDGWFANFRRGLPPRTKGECRTDDGAARVEVRMVGETVWLSLLQLSELFGRDKSVISRHIRNIFDEGKLPRDSVVANFATTAADEKTYQVEYYKPRRDHRRRLPRQVPAGVQFRIWATQRLREYLIKGFAMDDERLKAAGGGRYFEELLARIRDIRSSEKVFWRKVLEIYSTSIDYDPQTVLDRIVNFYLEFAELQALNRKPMTMQAWVTKLDNFPAHRQPALT